MPGCRCARVEEPRTASRIGLVARSSGGVPTVRVRTTWSRRLVRIRSRRELANPMASRQNVAGSAPSNPNFRDQSLSGGSQLKDIAEVIFLLSRRKIEAIVRGNHRQFHVADI